MGLGLGLELRLGWGLARAMMARACVQSSAHSSSSERCRRQAARLE